MKKRKDAKVTETQTELAIGGFLVYSCGGGCHDLFQIIKLTPKTVTVKELKPKIVRRSVKNQIYEELPVKDRFLENGETKTLRISEDGRIGPIKRLEGWYIWKKKPITEWCI